jgi:hypothetical protein
MKEAGLAKRRTATSRTLSRIATRLRQKIQLTEKMSSRMVELDIARCRIEKAIAAEWVKSRNEINQELVRLGMSEAEWCQNALGCSIQTMRRRVQLLRGWGRYLERRREVGDNGQYGLLYAVFLASPATQGELGTDSFRNNRSESSVHYGPGDSSQPQPHCRFITGDAQIELPSYPENR